MRTVSPKIVCMLYHKTPHTNHANVDKSHEEQNTF